MAVEPVNLGYALIFSKLTGDATFTAQVTGVFQGAAPAGTTGNFCILNLQSSTDTNTANGFRRLTRELFQVKICGPIENAPSIRSAYARADALLQPNGQPTRNTGGTLALFREQAISYTEVRADGTLWLHYGGLYAVEV